MADLAPRKDPPENLRNVRFVIGIIAGKGGVGKSMVAVNLARACKKQGLSVGLLDADIYGPSIRKMMPEERSPSESPTLPGRIVPAEAGGIKMISMAFFSESDVATAVRAPFVNGVIHQFIHKVNWGPLDILLIDFPPGTGDIQLTLAQEIRIDGVVIVTTPQEVALLDVRKAIHMCHQMALPILGIAENMSYWNDPTTGEKLYLLGQGGGNTLSLETGIPLLGEIPLEPLLAQAADRGEDLFSIAPGCGAVGVLLRVSEKIFEQMSDLEKIEGQYLKNFEVIWQSI